jgi:predicted trehalose synthase
MVVRQRHAVGGGQDATLDLMPQAEHVLAADADLAGELGGGRSLGDAAEDQEDLGGAEVGPLPGRVGVHVEDTAAALAAIIEDRCLGTAAVDVEAVARATPGAGEAFGVEQIEELLAATFLVHQVDDREVHGASSEEIKTIKPWDQETRSADG